MIYFPETDIYILPKTNNFAYFFFLLFLTHIYEMIKYDKSYTKIRST
jgi:hypothetical protein